MGSYKNNPDKLKQELGFSIVETLISLFLLALLLLTSSKLLIPTIKSSKRLALFNVMIQIENEIRAQSLNSKNYQNVENFIVRFGTKKIAQNEKIIYLNSSLEETQESDSDISTKLSVIKYFDSKQNKTRMGVAYQISAKDNSLRIKPLGVPEWGKNSELESQLIDLSTQENYLSLNWIDVPDKIAFSQSVKCEKGGFLRGINQDKSPKCWTLSEEKCPSWSVPIGYELINETSLIKIKCKKLQKPTCPGLKLTTVAGQSFELKNFYALNNIHLKDLYKTSKDSTASTCSLIIDFKAYNKTGVIPQSYVNQYGSSKCPDSVLYKKGINGECIPSFSISSVSEVVPVKFYE